MAESWSWGSVTEELKGGVKEFIRLCNTRFRRLETILGGKQRTIGWYDVRDYGAIPNALDTSTRNRLAINAAITAASGDGGGIVWVPDGTYMIDPDYNNGASVRLADNVTLLLSQRAVLQAIGGSISDYAVIYGSDLDNVAVTGHGTVIGERNNHTGSTGEHGHGLRLVECRGVLIDGITVKDCWGDGIYFGSNSSGTLPCEDVVVTPSVTVDNCRRNGISAVGVRHGRISGRITNINGTAPQAGVDIEPNFAGETYDCWTEGVIVDGCLGYGVYVTGSAVGAVPVNCGHRGAVVRNCEGGAYLGRGTLSGLINCSFVDSVNTGAGDRVVVVDANADDYTVSGNRAYLTTPDTGVTPYYLVDTTAAAYVGDNAAVGTAELSVLEVVRGVNVKSLTSSETLQVGGVGVVEVQLTNNAGDVVRFPSGGALIPAAATQDLGSTASPWRIAYANKVLAENAAESGSVTMLNRTASDNVQLGGTGAAEVQVTNATDTIGMPSGGHWRPAVDDSQDLGTSGLRWQQLFLSGDIESAAGGFRQTVDGWLQDNVTASQTDVELTRVAGRFRAVRAGSVTGVIVTSTEARTAGTLTVTVFKNTGLAGAAGSTIGLTAVLDGTNTSRKATTQAKDADTFAAGDELYVVVTTDGSWTPTTADIRVAIEIED